jgi:endonuclease YncB( thermonuclease family)
MRHWIVLCLFILLIPSALAAIEVKGSISWVSDGDTVWLRPDAGQNLGQVQLDKGRVKLRLEAIDAPETCQDWGQEATAALKTQVLHQTVRAQLLHPDQYGRWLARLYLPQAQDLDVNAWLVAQGHAWDYQFVNGKPGRYAPLQTQAKTAGRGLWALPSPVQPRVFRRQHGACDYAQQPVRSKAEAAVETAAPQSNGQSSEPNHWQAIGQWLTQQISSIKK